MNHPQLNPRGLELLVALLRYVAQHGNVQKAASKAARLLLSACGDEDLIDYTGKEQRRLDAALLVLEQRTKQSTGSSPPAAQPK